MLTPSLRSLAAYEPFAKVLLHWSARQTKFTCRPHLADVLKQNPRLIVAISHSSPLSWLPAACLLDLTACENGGADRKPVSVMDRFFFQVPGVDFLAKFITQSEAPLGFAEILKNFERNENFDLVIFPEGSNCFFGEPEALQEFRSPKFVELSLRAEVPILLCVHRGSESWAKTVTISDGAAAVVSHSLKKLPKFPFEFVSDFFADRIAKNKQVAVPMVPLPMELFSMHCELYEPTLKLADLSDNDDEKQIQIEGESRRIHEKMKELLAGLGQAV